MTSLVGIRCKDGVVIGADSSATFGDGQFLRTIEQHTERKIETIDDQVIVAGTGYVGHAQRFCRVVKQQFRKGEFKGKNGEDIAKLLSAGGVNDFCQTIPEPHIRSIDFSALVAYMAGGTPFLCELPGKIGFQPEIKLPEDLWFTSAGSGQQLTDPFLALLRQIYWSDGPPNVQGGIFMATWALRHACDLNTGGINGADQSCSACARQG